MSQEKCPLCGEEGPETTGQGARLRACMNISCRVNEYIVED